MAKRSVQKTEQSSHPRALIIGGSTTAGYLSRILQENGCKVDIFGKGNFEKQQKKVSTKYQYIFQFGNIEFVKNVVSTLMPDGKFLFIDTNFEDVQKLTEKYKIKILKVGDMGLWTLPDLSEKILKTIFSKEISTLNVAKGSPVIKKDIIKKIPIEEKKRILEKEKDEIKKVDKKNTKKLRKTKVQVKRVFGKKKIVIFLIILVSIISVISGSFYWYAKSTKEIFMSFQKNLAASNFENVSKDLDSIKSRIQMAKSIYDSVYNYFPFLRNIQIIKDVGEILYVGNNLVYTGEDVVLFFKEIKMESLDSNFSTKGVSAKDMNTVKIKIGNLKDAILSSKETMDKTNLPFFPKAEFSILLVNSYDKLSSVTELLPLVESLFINSQAKTYLVLFQNNMELRPTGGFIGSFGLLTVGEGKFYDLQIMDVYSADGQLKGHVNPPEPIKKYLNQPHFFLRDSNWEPDFAKSSIQAMWFLDKELNKRVDGVIGINLFFIQELLKYIGPLNLPDFNNEEINSNNFFFKAHYYTQKDFFPGSTQKKDFLTAVANSMQTKFFTKKDLAIWDLFLGVKKMLDEKNLIIYTKDMKMQNQLEEYTWAGRMSTVGCVENNETGEQVLYSNDGSCISDYLSIVEANLGVNKANYFIEKTVTVEKKIESSGRIVNVVTLAFENKGMSEVFQGGTYSDYLRLFVPKGSRLMSIMLNNSKIDSSKIDIEGYEDDKTVFGVLVKIAPNNRGTVKVSYVLPQSITDKTKYFQFFYQKQAGDKISPLVLSLITPNEIKLNPLNFKSNATKETEIFFTTDTSVDRIFAFQKR